MKGDGRGSSEEWQQLRKDKRSAIVVSAVIIAGVAAVLALLGLLLGGSRVGDRGNPIYWAMLLPFAWWAASLANYTPWAIRALRPAAAAFAIVACAAAGMAFRQKSDVLLWMVAASISCICAMAGTILYPGSLVAKRIGGA